MVKNAVKSGIKRVFGKNKNIGKSLENTEFFSIFQGFFFLAEKERFELSNRLWRFHDFQSCALDQLGDFSITNMRCGFHRALIVYHKKIATSQ